MRRYACAVVLGDWFGLPWRHEPEVRADVAISLEGSVGELRLPDLLLGISASDWLTPASLPRLPLTQWDVRSPGANAALVTPSLPILYGAAATEIERAGDTLNLPLDVLGSIFFMLTGYDELACKERDAHGRFPAAASLAQRAGFLERPLADEYAELLWHAMHSLWPQLRRRSLAPKLVLSCDVDEPFDSTVENLRILLRTCTGDFLKRRKPAMALQRVRRFVANRRGDYRHDPCYSFDTYLDLCREFGLQSAFYFIPSSTEPNNGCYTLTQPRIQRLLRKLADAGHEIGMHGCYQAYRDPVRTRAHRDLLAAALVQAGIDQPLWGNRQHYLRWDSALTPAALEAAGLAYDTSGGFADCAGFRFGTAREFPMWDWTAEAPLKLRQRPLIVMDCTITDDVYMGLGRGDAARARIALLRERALRFGGQFTVLWHNTSLSTADDVALLKAAIEPS
ncbi:polysaccharide deacetylase family protein [Herbaspirillum seropedicae]|uniref:polysaccharide deacetylase family protein n=1 Tax=Herbaspirillum seropedicae TaxID=964 RepID=UPI003FCE01F4